eukprot:3555259-Rhodomonas_salina.1
MTMTMTMTMTMMMMMMMIAMMMMMMTMMMCRGACKLQSHAALAPPSPRHQTPRAKKLGDLVKRKPNL